MKQSYDGRFFKTPKKCDCGANADCHEFCEKHWHSHGKQKYLDEAARVAQELNGDSEAVAQELNDGMWAKAKAATQLTLQACRISK